MQYITTRSPSFKVAWFLPLGMIILVTSMASNLSSTWSLPTWKFQVFSPCCAHMALSILCFKLVCSNDFNISWHIIPYYTYMIIPNPPNALQTSTTHDHNSYTKIPKQNLSSQNQKYYINVWHISQTTGLQSTIPPLKPKHSVLWTKFQCWSLIQRLTSQESQFYYNCTD